MRSVGHVIKEERVAKGLTLDNLASETKIKREFIRAIEKGNWGALPEYPVVSGFVKNIFKSLELDENSGLALLRRDYPPQKLPVNPKPDVSREFVWSPKLTFLTGIGAVALAILGYLIFQYIGFISPPRLNVDTPTDGQVITSNKVTVSGSTDTEASINVNNQPVIVGEDGRFESQVEVVTETREVVVTAKSRSGKETRISRKIEVRLGS